MACALLRRLEHGDVTAAQILPDAMRLLLDSRQYLLNTAQRFTESHAMPMTFVLPMSTMKAMNEAAVNDASDSMQRLATEARRKFDQALDERIGQLVDLGYRGPVYTWLGADPLLFHVSITAPAPGSTSAMKYEIDDVGAEAWKALREASR